MNKWGKRGGAEWSKKMRDERSKKGGVEIEGQSKKSEADLEKWIGAISTELLE